MCSLFLFRLVSSSICTRKTLFLSSHSSRFFHFDRDSSETLESLNDLIEAAIEDDKSMEEADIQLASGVLTVSLPEPHGTYVINKQSPNQQIWLSSPVSGPARYDFDPERNTWVYSRTGRSLHELLEEEIGKGGVLGRELGFKDCHLGGGEGE